MPQGSKYCKVIPVFLRYEKCFGIQNTGTGSLPSASVPSAFLVLLLTELPDFIFIQALKY